MCVCQLEISCLALDDSGDAVNCILYTFPLYFQAALIMQVLQLTDQQIAMLPPDQRQSILILKDQLTKNAV